MSHHFAPLKSLSPGWFAIVMGLSGLALAWLRALPFLGEPAGMAALLLGGLAALVFGLLAALSLLRWRRYPQALAEDLRHPVRHAFAAALPVSLILLATVAVALVGPGPLAAGMWMAGAGLQLGVTVWTLGRWLRPAGAEGLSWPSITPLLFLPAVGNVLAPLAGVPLGHPDWSAAQLGVGLLLWPLVLALLALRIAASGPWPTPLLPTTFITVAPPAAIGLALLQLGAPLLLGWSFWGMGLFFVLWSGGVLKRGLRQPFGLTFWSLSFPLAAFSALSLRLALDAAPWFQAMACLVLVAVTLVIALLALATVKGLCSGRLPAPEPEPAVPAAQ